MKSRSREIGVGVDRGFTSSSDNRGHYSGRGEDDNNKTLLNSYHDLPWQRHIQNWWQTRTRVLWGHTCEFSISSFISYDMVPICSSPGVTACNYRSYLHHPNGVFDSYRYRWPWVKVTIGKKLRFGDLPPQNDFVFMPKLFQVLFRSYFFFSWKW